MDEQNPLLTPPHNHERPAGYDTEPWGEIYRFQPRTLRDARFPELYPLSYQRCLKTRSKGWILLFDIPPHQQLEKQTSHLQPSQLQHHLISDLLVRRGFPLAFDPYSEEPMENVTNQPQKSNEFAYRGDFPHEPSILSTTTYRMIDRNMEENENLLASEDDRRLSGMERRKLRNRAAARKSRQKKNSGLTSVSR
ncbi:hypothetical protein BS50DRAFT_594950 [Corynespora cassiicola Philippines]|uniref:BZIP domain-containing protein n=1 Tax=Corynespora cassiicola Philippines TaxID=1448308 RepID=A0A2T2N1F8_CORCC|nr:hypothetical protein BS50DRAFT_594950 [Corynespora cassiicola Philippines]